MTLTLDEMKANRKLWVEALRSGKYEQCEGFLHKKDGGYCCLGVLAELAGCEWQDESADNDYFLTGDNLTQAPPAAIEFVGLSQMLGLYEDGRSLAKANDDGKSFTDIADIIESEPPGLFISPEGN